MPGYVYKGRTKEPPTIVTRQDKRRGKTGKRLARCGTNSGYGRHIRDGEHPCDACKDAHNAKRAIERGGRVTGMRKGNAQHGTYAGAVKHRKSKQSMCFPCAEAERIYHAELRAKYQAEGRKLRSVIKQHGTERGYQAHVRSGVPSCAPCRAAHAENARKYRNTSKPAPAPHGTPDGYKAHKRAGTMPCAECRTANAAYQRTYRARKDQAA
ncbi:MAG: hypothetical protein ACTH9H_13125 [Galactobacter sp.]